MNIREILIYSHSGELRRIKFFVQGLNIITGRSSTGKSALSDIVEYCMGRSTFNIPEGPIRDKVAWYAVIYQFDGEQVLIAKPAPISSAASCSRAMIRRGAVIEPPDFSDLQQNADDDTVTALLSELLGIPANRTEVSKEQSRDSFAATIKHTYFYLFQKQGLIANKEQLFYRQNEPFIPQAIKDTLPILLGVAPDNRLDLDHKLRVAKRDLKMTQRQLADALQFGQELDEKALSLLSEAKQVGLFSHSLSPTTPNELLVLLSDVVKWKPAPIPDEDTRRISILEDEVASIRKDKAIANETLRAAQIFAKNEDGFTIEAQEQKSRLESIRALPNKTDSGEWQWPFAPANLGLDTPIGEALLKELQTLDRELDSVTGDRPQLEEYIQNLESQILDLTKLVRSKEEELSAAISANSVIAEMGNRNAAAARTVGRISLFLESYKPDLAITVLKNRVQDLQATVIKLENDLGANDGEDRFASILNIISNKLSHYVKELDAEFKEYPFRLDMSNLTVVADRAERPIPMNKTGGGANHLAYHLAAMLALHHFAIKNSKPIPSFIFLDQPTQVYFPSEQKYKSASGSIEDTERDADLEKVRKLFEMLYRYATEEAPGFQIIVTEHANLRDSWFQNSIVETPWTKPPALVPDEWKMPL